MPSINLTHEFQERNLFSPDHTPPRRTVADKMSPMRFLGATSKEDTLNEINRKMQRALEETLTKNIHLQEVDTSLLQYIYNVFTMKITFEIIIYGTSNKQTPYLRIIR